MSCVIPSEFTFVFLILLCQIVFISSGLHIDNEHHDVNTGLANIFFKNLQNHPLLAEKTLTPFNKIFVDKQIHNFLTSVQNLPRGTTKLRIRRDTNKNSFLKDETGIFKFKGFTIKKVNIVSHPIDIILFVHPTNSVFVAILESDNVANTNFSNWFSIYKLLDTDQFVRMHKIPVTGAKQLKSFSIGNLTYFNLVKFISETVDSIEIYEFNLEYNLKFVQSLSISKSRDVSIWKFAKSIYFSVATNGNSNPIYKWAGKHFDIINYINRENVQTFLPLNIGNSLFIIVIKRENAVISSEIFCEVYKFDLDSEIFILYQNLITQSAEVKHFYYQQKHLQEHFLIIANPYKLDTVVYKFVDDYFVPFQTFSIMGIKKWFPIVGSKGELVLMAVCKNDLRYFQYDGWRFVETNIGTQIETENFISDSVSIIYSKILHKKTVLVFINKSDKGYYANILTANFERQHMLANFENSLETWCLRTLQIVEAERFNEVFQHLKDAPTVYDSDIAVRGNAFFNFVSVDNLHTFEINDMDGNSLERNEIKELQSMERTMDSQLFELSNKESGSFANKTRIENNSDQTIIRANVVAETIFFGTSETTFLDMNTDFFNDYNVQDTLRNRVEINQDIALQNALEFKDLTVLENLNCSLVNGVRQQDFLHKQSFLNISKLQIIGKVTFEKGLSVVGLVDGVNISENSILTHTNHQKLGKNIRFAEVNAKNVYFPSMNLDVNRSNIGTSEKPLVVSELESLDVNNIFVRGFINEVDISTLDKYALKIKGQQTLKADYEFDTLRVEEFRSEGFISNVKIQEDLVSVLDGSFIVQQDVFLTEMVADELRIAKRINAITVSGERLQVLLKNSSQRQIVRGLKVFENMELRNPIGLHGKIKSKSLEKMNPVAIVEEELNLVGDYHISGNVSIEGFVSADDIISSDEGKLSLKRLHQEGLKLDEGDVSRNVIFKQVLNVDSLSVSTVNDVTPELWLTTNSNYTHIISGWTTFSGNVHVTGKSKAITINGINVDDLENDLMKIYGNQTVFGTHFVQNLKAGRIHCEGLKFGKDLAEVLTLDGDQTIKGVAKFKGLAKVGILDAKTLSINNIYNGISVDELLSDIVRLDVPYARTISGLKDFKSNLSISNLSLPLNETAGASNATVDIGSWTADKSLRLNRASVTEINVRSGSLINGVRSEHFGEHLATMSVNDEQIISGNVRFKTVKIFGKTLANSGKINGISVGDVVENSVKIYENFGFAFADLPAGVQSFGDVVLLGNLGKVNFQQLSEEVFNSNVSGFFNNVRFMETVTVDGEFIANHILNNLNTTELCAYANPTENEKSPHLIINGNAYFAMGPKLRMINDNDVELVLRNAWFSHKQTELTGNVEIKTAIFQNHVMVHNLVNGVDLGWLKDNYFSKTKDQTVEAVLHFRDGVIFEDSVSAKHVKVAEKFAGIDLEAFTRTALINSYDQVFDVSLVAENCTFLDLAGNYTVNSYNFLKDLLRYDVTNASLAGRKTIANVTAKSLNVAKDIRIQNVYLYQYLTDAVLKSGSFTVKGMKSFLYETVFNAIGLKGLLNGIYFDKQNVMFKSIPQEVSGIKVFTDFVKSLEINKLYVEGSLNEIDVKTLSVNQVFKDNNNNAISSPVLFSKSLQANNVNFVNSYDSTNISKLIFDIENNMLSYNYQKEFENLLENATHIGQSLSTQAYFLKNYIIFQIFPKFTKIAAVDFSGSGYRELAVMNQNENEAHIDFFVWNFDTEKFVVDKTIQRMTFYGKVIALETVTLSQRDYLYVERINEAEPRPAATSLGRLFKRTDTVDLQLIQEIPQNSSVSVTSVHLVEENQDCVFFLNLENNWAKLFCEVLPYRNGTLQLHQEIPLSGTPLQATSLVIGSISYVIIAKKRESVEVWRYENQQRIFVPYQIIPTEIPSAVTSVEYRGQFYLAIASGHLKNAIYQGLIEIRRFDAKMGHFEILQQLDLNFPTSIEFVVLPTDELVLYVLTNSPSQPFMVYMYEGITGFNAKVTESTISKYTRLRTCTQRNRMHFVLLSNDYESSLVQGVFHGHSWISSKNERHMLRKSESEDEETS